MPVTPSPAVLRALDVLEHLRDRPEESFTLSELARRLGLPRATAHAVLLALAKRGYVTRRGTTHEYRLGAACLRLGEAARAAAPVLDVAQVESRALAESTGFCIAAGGLVDGNVTVLLVEEAAGPFGVSIRPGHAVPMQPPFGSVFVAWDAEAVEPWLETLRPALRPAEKARYRRTLASMRRRGYGINVHTTRQPALAMDVIDADAGSAQSRERREKLIRTFAHSEFLVDALDAAGSYRLALLSAPVFDPSGAVTLELMLLGPPYDLPASEVERLGRALQAAARRTSEAVGGTAPADA
jgi:DNA-binding IclR family transcriptional regulator